jgi:hypothetical protein
MQSYESPFVRYVAGFLTPLLVSMQDFAFRGRPVSLLVAALLRGLTCLAFPAGVFVLHSNQQLEQSNTHKVTFDSSLMKGIFLKKEHSKTGC